MTDQNARTFLLTRGADEIPHPGGTLYAHLCRVADTLGAWGAGPDVRLAGLCHATYGTDGFGTALLDVADRATLVEAIGGPAEALVHRYGSCVRSAVYPQLGGVGPVRFTDRFTGREHVPAERDIRAFAEITAANELDVLAHNAELAAEHGPGLFRLFTAARARLSEPAWQATVAQLGPV